jgi:hypothetical protein
MPRGTPLSDERIEAAIQELGNGATITAAARAIGVNHSVLIRAFERDPDLTRRVTKAERSGARKRLARRNRDRAAALRRQGITPAQRPELDRRATGQDDTRRPATGVPGQTRVTAFWVGRHDLSGDPRGAASPSGGMLGDSRRAYETWVSDLEAETSDPTFEVRLRDPDTQEELDYKCVSRHEAIYLRDHHGYEVLV